MFIANIYIFFNQGFINPASNQPKRQTLTKDKVRSIEQSTNPLTSIVECRILCPISSICGLHGSLLCNWKQSSADARDTRCRAWFRFERHKKRHQIDQQFLCGPRESQQSQRRRHQIPLTHQVWSGDTLDALRCGVATSPAPTLQIWALPTFCCILL